MDNRIVAFSVETFLRQLRQRLEEAQGLAQAADACARVGQLAPAVTLGNQADEPIHDAEQLLGMAAALIRYSERRDGAPVPPIARNEEGNADASVDAALAEKTIRAFLQTALRRLDSAVSAATAAEVLAAAGKAEDGVRYALDIEPLLYDARHLINTASMMNRLSKRSEATPQD